MLFAPNDVKGVSLAVEQLLNSRPLRTMLAEKGRARAAQFTWEKTARKTIAVWQEMLLDCASPLALSNARHPPKAPEDGRSPKRVQKSLSSGLPPGKTPAAIAPKPWPLLAVWLAPSRSEPLTPPELNPPLSSKAYPPRPNSSCAAC